MDPLTHAMNNPRVSTIYNSTHKYQCMSPAFEVSRNTRLWSGEMATPGDFPSQYEFLLNSNGICNRLLFRSPQIHGNRIHTLEVEIRFPRILTIAAETLRASETENRRR